MILLGAYGINSQGFWALCASILTLMMYLGLFSVVAGMITIQTLLNVSFVAARTTTFKFLGLLVLHKHVSVDLAVWEARLQSIHSAHGMQVYSV